MIIMKNYYKVAYRDEVVKINKKNWEVSWGADSIMFARDAMNTDVDFNYDSFIENCNMIDNITDVIKSRWYRAGYDEEDVLKYAGGKYDKFGETVIRETLENFAKKYNLRFYEE